MRENMSGDASRIVDNILVGCMLIRVRAAGYLMRVVENSAEYDRCGGVSPQNEKAEDNVGGRVIPKKLDIVIRQPEPSVGVRANR